MLFEYICRLSCRFFFYFFFLFFDVISNLTIAAVRNDKSRLFDFVKRISIFICSQYMRDYKKRIEKKKFWRKKELMGYRKDELHNTYTKNRIEKKEAKFTRKGQFFNSLIGSKAQRTPSLFTKRFNSAFQLA